MILLTEVYSFCHWIHIQILHPFETESRSGTRIKPSFQLFQKSLICSRRFELCTCVCRYGGNSLKKYRKKEILIAGDFNAKAYAWGSKIEDAKGKILLEWIAKHQLIIRIEETKQHLQDTGKSRT